ncbi:hypothetical protein ACQPZZ_34245 [Microbispora sp. CA-135349]|uniref:hypothetical protein n=1 Tax=Microbispora sp. CA-135349 TaxID=3239953 RepID=UPI003D8D856B
MLDIVARPDESHLTFSGRLGIVTEAPSFAHHIRTRRQIPRKCIGGRAIEFSTSDTPTGWNRN